MLEHRGRSRIGRPVDTTRFYLSMSLKTWLILTLPLLWLACSGVPFVSPAPTPTSPAWILDVAVTVIAPQRPVTNTPSVLNVIIPTPTLISTDTPEPPPTPTLTPTPAPPTLPPTPAPTATPTTENFGTISLAEPQSNLVLPATIRDFEFKWRWSRGEGCQLPSEYVFELRLWPTRLDFAGPIPAMDALQDRSAVFCDPVSGLFGFRVDNLKNTAGAQAVAVQTAATGDFFWNVALLKIFPDIKPVATSDTRMFTIPSDYVGPYDTSRPTVTCSNFSVWLEAQALFLATGGPGPDINGLDPDGNGIACDELRK